MLDPDRCPPDPEEIAESYLMHRLAPDDERAFENHSVCARCAGIVEAMDAYVVAMRRAAERLRREGIT